MDPAPDWRLQANCRGMDPELFFPSKGDLVAVRSARAVCAACVVRPECLAYALALPGLDTLGIWGGTTFKQRATLRRRVRRATASTA